LIDVFGLAGQLRGALALLGQGLLRHRQPLLALVDEQREPVALLREREQVPRQAPALLGNLFAQADQFGQVGRQHFGLMPHLGQRGPQDHRRTYRLQCVLGPEHEAGRSLPTDPLQRRQHLGNEGASLLQRCLQRLLVVVERFDPLLGLGDPLFHGDDPRRGLDDLLIEFAPVVADRFDLALELGLVLERPALLAAEDFELLVALLEGIEAGRGGRTLPGLGRRGARAGRLGGRGHQPKRQEPQGRQGHPTESGGKHGLHQPVLCKNGSNPAMDNHDWYRIKTFPPPVSGSRGGRLTRDDRDVRPGS
jgi:hypothetical protein